MPRPFGGAPHWTSDPSVVKVAALWAVIGRSVALCRADPRHGGLDDLLRSYYGVADHDRRPEVAALDQRFSRRPARACTVGVYRSCGAPALRFVDPATCYRHSAAEVCVENRRRRLGWLEAMAGLGPPAHLQALVGRCRNLCPKAA